MNHAQRTTRVSNAARLLSPRRLLGPAWDDSDMSEKRPEREDPRESAPIELSHLEERSITGSGQTIGLAPGDNYISPTMALDSLEFEQDQSGS